jgi:hypothetical protein
MLDLQENVVTLVNVVVNFTFVLLVICFPSKALWWPVDSTSMVVFWSNIGLGVQPFITLGFPLALYFWQKVRAHNTIYKHCIKLARRYSDSVVCGIVGSEMLTYVLIAEACRGYS